MSGAYPARPPHFDRRFMKAMVERSAGASVGPDGFALLSLIVCQEDRIRYVGAVDFWSSQLTMTLGVSEDTLIRIRKRCVEKGWLHYEHGARGRAARYWVLIPGQTEPQLAGQSDEIEPQVAGQPGEIDTQVAVVSPANRPPMLGTSLPNPNPNPKDPPTPVPGDCAAAEKTEGKKPRKRSPRTKPPEHPLFEQFYSAYPRKEARVAAAKAFANLNPDESLLAALLSAVERHRKSGHWTKDNGRYIPHPATWLNGKRWEDQPPEVINAPRPGERPHIHDQLQPPLFTKGSKA